MVKYADLAPELLVENHGDVRVLTMNAPEQLNSVDGALHHALYQVWDALAEDQDAAAVVLTGAGRAFSAGGNLPYLQRVHDDPIERRASVRGAERLTRAMINSELPIVAAVNGPAIGLGASLAVLCDLVVIADDTFMSDPHVNVGLVAGDGGAVSWPLMMSLLKAKEHLLLGTRIPAAECVELGLANRVASAADVLPTALELAERLAAQPRQALRDTKRALNFHLRQAADLVLDFALAAESESFAGDDLLATIDRMKNKA